MSFKFAFWAIGALVLFAAEAMAPGAFMLWFGFAAVAMALVVLVAPGLGWLAQAVLFSVLALISVAVYRRWFRGKGRQSDKPLLNRRAEQMVGSIAVLENGVGSFTPPADFLKAIADFGLARCCSSSSATATAIEPSARPCPTFAAFRVAAAAAISARYSDTTAPPDGLKPSEVSAITIPSFHEIIPAAFASASASFSQYGSRSMVSRIVVATTALPAWCSRCAAA